MVFGVAHLISNSLFATEVPCKNEVQIFHLANYIPITNKIKTHENHKAKKRAGSCTKSGMRSSDTLLEPDPFTGHIDQMIMSNETNSMKSQRRASSFAI